jgi:uncharacterized protein (TIGR01777 family)
MRVLISGASGLIGSALMRRLSAPPQAKAASGGDPFERSGSSVTRLVRKPASQSPLHPAPPATAGVAVAGVAELPWKPGERLDPALISGFDAVIHLAGRSLAGRWTPSSKREIRDSRLAGTSTIACAVAESFRACGQPAVLVSASAVGYYGNRGSELLSESSGCGTGFLAELCRDWESAAMEAAGAGVRVLTPRFGLVLSREGGALAKMLPAFRLCLGGPLGAGKQFWSWITLEDAVAAVEFMIARQQLSGPVNVVSPKPVSNDEFTQMLAQALRRPAVLPVPAFALRLVFGEMADEALLSSQRVQPAKLASSGFQWHQPELPAALRAVLGN